MNQRAIIGMIVVFQNSLVYSVAYPGILFGGGGSTNSIEDRGQRTGIWGW